MKDQSKISIIGAGISGILTAIALKQKGYTNICLYEKENRVANMTHSFVFDQHTFDYSTKLIPSINFYSAGIYPPLLDLIEKTKMSLVLPPEPKFYDFIKNKKLLMPPVMKQFGKLKVVSDFARGYKLLTGLKNCTSINDIYKTGIISPDEDVIEWGKRHRLESLAALTNYIVDLFNMGPSQDIPAAFVMTSRIHFLAPYLHTILSKPIVKFFFLIFGSKKHPDFHQFINFPKKESKYFIFKEGYETFFKRLVEAYELEVVYNTSITDIKQVGEKTSLRINGTEDILSDALIFCCPPEAIAALTPHQPVADLFKKVKQKRFIRTWAFEVEEWDNKRFGEKNYIIDGNNRMDMGGAGFVANGELMYVAKDFKDSNLIMSAVYASPEMSENALKVALEKSLTKFGLKLKSVVGYRDFLWPNHPNLKACKASWYESIEAFQGVDNIYYSGEAMSGIGVPTILEHCLKFAEKFKKGE